MFGDDETHFPAFTATWGCGAGGIIHAVSHAPRRGGISENIDKFTRFFDKFINVK